MEQIINNRHTWIDIIRIFAILAVLAIHVDSIFILMYNKISWVDWWASNFYSSLIHFAVPMFIMLSGYLLLDKQEDDKLFYSKRLYKVVIPLFAWSIIYMIFKTNYNLYSVFTVDFVKQFLSANIYYHLYFLDLIIGLYLITPFLRKILAKADICDVYRYLVLWFIFTPVVQLLSIFGYQVSLPVEVATGYLGYYILGYTIKKSVINDKIVLIAAVAVTASIIITAIGTYIMTVDKGQFNDYFISWYSLTTLANSIGLFILLRRVFSRADLHKWEEPIRIVGISTMGIYLVHPILLDFIFNGVFGVHLLSVDVLSPIISIPLVTGLLFVSSLVFVLVLQKIPLVKFIIP